MVTVGRESSTILNAASPLPPPSLHRLSIISSSASCQTIHAPFMITAPRNTSAKSHLGRKSKTTQLILPQITTHPFAMREILKGFDCSSLFTNRRSDRTRVLCVICKEYLFVHLFPGHASRFAIIATTVELPSPNLLLRQPNKVRVLSILICWTQ